jgi:hypothetical protein
MPAVPQEISGPEKAERIRTGRWTPRIILLELFLLQLLLQLVFAGIISATVPESLFSRELFLLQFLLVSW